MGSRSPMLGWVVFSPFKYAACGDRLFNCASTTDVRLKKHLARIREIDFAGPKSSNEKKQAFSMVESSMQI